MLISLRLHPHCFLLHILLLSRTIRSKSTFFRLFLWVDLLWSSVALLVEKDIVNTGFRKLPFGKLKRKWEHMLACWPRPIANVISFLKRHQVLYLFQLHCQIMYFVICFMTTSKAFNFEDPTLKKVGTFGAEIDRRRSAEPWRTNYFLLETW